VLIGSDEEPHRTERSAWRLVGPADLVESSSVGGGGEVRLYRGKFARSDVHDEGGTKNIYWLEVQATQDDSAYRLWAYDLTPGELGDPCSSVVLQMRDNRHGAVAWDRWPIVCLTEFSFPDDFSKLQAVSPRFGGELRDPPLQFGLPGTLGVPARHGLCVISNSSMDMLSVPDLLRDVGIQACAASAKPIRVKQLRWLDDRRYWELKLLVRSDVSQETGRENVARGTQEREVSLFRIASDHRWTVRAPNRSPIDVPRNQTPSAQLDRSRLSGGWWFAMGLVGGALAGLGGVVVRSRLKHGPRPTRLGVESERSRGAGHPPRRGPDPSEDLQDGSGRGAM
jgi:hypothetical protein